MYVCECIGAYELQSRIYPVIWDTNTVKLTGGTNNLTLTSTKIEGKN